MISLKPEVLFQIGPVPFTNTLLHILIVDVLILVGIYFLHKNLSKIPGLFQNMVEYVVDGFYGLTESISPTQVKAIFPFFIGFFVFIFITNITALFPGFGTIGIRKGEEFIPILRAANSDFNVTFALAIISAVATHILAVRAVGIKDYLLRYFSLNPIFLFVGLLELVSELTKIISLSFRLFGNILAGDAVLTTVSSMFAFFLPLPFMSLEIIVALVQALVFSILTMVFMSILTTPHHEPAEHSTKGGEIHE